LGARLKDRGTVEAIKEAIVGGRLMTMRHGEDGDEGRGKGAVA
jgi:hypothetical protein